MSTAAIDPKTVMKLRQKTGLGMGACKDALVEANGDFDAAEKLLRERMKDKMDGRTDRPAGEGCLAIATGAGKIAIVEIRSETDFTAKNAEFRTMASDVATLALGGAAGSVTATPAITTRVDDVRLKTGENVQFARGEVMAGKSYAHYLHHDHKQGAVLEFTGTLDAETGAAICQHIVASPVTPQAIDEHGLPQADVAQKRAEAAAEAAASGKPAQIADKMAEGKMRKWFEEVTLLGQAFVFDEKKKIKDLLPAGTTLTAFRRMVVGGS